MEICSRHRAGLYAPRISSGVVLLIAAGLGDVPGRLSCGGAVVIQPPVVVIRLLFMILAFIRHVTYLKIQLRKNPHKSAIPLSLK